MAAEFPTIPDYSRRYFGQALVRFIDTEAFVHSALVGPCMHLEKRPHMTFCRGPNSHRAWI
jgi:hypothetical protein